MGHICGPERFDRKLVVPARVGAGSILSHAPLSTSFLDLSQSVAAPVLELRKSIKVNLQACMKESGGTRQRPGSSCLELVLQSLSHSRHSMSESSPT